MDSMFSANRLETWQKCKKKYYYSFVKKLYMPDFDKESAQTGSDVHRLVYYYLKGFKVEQYLKNLDETTKTHFLTLINHPIMQNKPILYEWGFNSRIVNTENWLNGRIDAVFYDENRDKYIICDWKTGKNVEKDIENTFQCMIYLYSFYNARNDLKLAIEPQNIEFQIIKTSGNQNITPVEYSAQKQALFEKRFTDEIKAIQSEKDFPKIAETPVSQCNYCQYFSLCFSMSMF